MLITNAKLITWEEPNQVLEGQAGLVEGDKIAAIGEEAEMVRTYAAAERVDAAGQIVMPGNICAHTHFYGAYARGLAIPGPAPKDFPEILQKLWWPLDRSLRLEDICSSAEVMVQCDKHGTTT
jgi:cytosine/adenosine deaminase-related metal-dependent hydrolase